MPLVTILSWILSRWASSTSYVAAAVVMIIFTVSISMLLRYVEMISGYDHLKLMIISGNSLISGLSDILNIKYLCSSSTYYRFDINEVYCPFLLTYVEISADVGVQHQHHVPSCPLADGDPGPGGHGGHHVRVLRGHHHCLLRYPHGLAL